MTTTSLPADQATPDTQAVSVGGDLPSDLPADQRRDDAHGRCVGGGSTSASPDQIPAATASAFASGLADPLLALLADSLDDLERTRIANENRLRQLTRTGPDKDGKERGFGLTVEHPVVAGQAVIVDNLKALEHQAELNLRRRLRRHPLGPWVQATVGVGEKQGARLLAAVGDPYWHTVNDRPRTVGQLIAYCGLNPRGGVAPHRMKGTVVDWNPAARMRVRLVAESCIKQAASPYRAVYDAGRVKYADAAHRAPCLRCGPSGDPALTGSPLSLGHQHGRALHLVMRRIMVDLWEAAREVHGNPPSDYGAC